MAMRATFLVLGAVSALSACTAPRAPAPAPIEFRQADHDGGVPIDGVIEEGAPVEYRVSEAAPVASGPARIAPPRAEDEASDPDLAWYENDLELSQPSQENGAVPGTGGVNSDNPTEITVQPGDTLFQLSEAHMVSLRALIDENQLQPPFQLQAGATLRIPEPNSYVIQDGDTLYSVARRYSVHFRSLANLNDIDAPFTVSPGESIVLPPMARDWTAHAAPAETPAEVGAETHARAAAGGSGGFDWPLRGRVVRGFGVDEAGRRNDGLNILADEGDPVRAVADGRVVYAGDELAGYGQLLLVQHADGWVSAYAHNRAVLVAENATVTRGQTIAEAGSTGSVETTQLHFELRRNGRPVDPSTLLPEASG